jgi:hypothetical protein
MTLRYNAFQIEDERPDTSEIRARKGLVGGGVFHGAEYRNYEKELNELAEIVESLRQNKEEKAAETEAKAPVKCPHCGAVTTPDANGCCEYCGLPVEPRA